MSRRAGRWVVAALLVAIATGCGGGAAPSVPSTTNGPSSSMPVLGEAELAVCDGIVRMSDGATRLRAVRLRKGAENRLNSALDLVVEGQRLVVDYAPSRMRDRVRTLGFAVTNMTIAVEDFRTTDRYAAAASNVKRRTTALHRAIDGFRSWVGCPGDTTEDAEPVADGSPSTGDTASPGA